MLKRKYFDMIGLIFQKFFIYFSVFVFWLSIFVGFLFFPKLTEDQQLKNTLYVFTWPGILDTEYIKQFEEKTGIRVKISYYESNEELLVKLKATGGKGYDLIVPSDYTVNILRKSNLLQPLDFTRLSFFNRLNPLLLNKYYDPSSAYSIPWDWGIYGLGVDSTYFASGLPEASWALVFKLDQPDKYPVGMVNDPHEAFYMAKRYLFGDQKNITEWHIQEITKLLRKQHRYISAYTDARADYLLATHNCAIVVSASPYMNRGMRQYPHIKFLVPKEGTILTIENFAIPVASTKKDMIYSFLNFLYSPESIWHHFNNNALLPATVDPQKWVNISEDIKKFLLPTPEEFEKFHFLESLMSEKRLNELWVEVKS